MPEYSTRLGPCIDSFHARAEAQLSLQLDWWAKVAADYCESEIERLLALSWMIHLHTESLFSRSWGEADYSFTPEKYGLEFLNATTMHSNFQRKDVMVPQVHIESYRVDFVLKRLMQVAGSGAFVESPKIVIECDGHDFHERTKEQAARDRSRDRELQTMGYRVMRFTGSEIWRDPVACTLQIEKFMSGLIDPIVEAEFAKWDDKHREKFGDKPGI